MWQDRRVLIQEEDPARTALIKSMRDNLLGEKIQVENYDLKNMKGLEEDNKEAQRVKRRSTSGIARPRGRRRGPLTNYSRNFKKNSKNSRRMASMSNV